VCERERERGVCVRERVVCVACERERESGVCGEGGGAGGVGG